MTTAILLTCHGTVEATRDLPAFLANIRRGRPTPEAIVQEVKHRFEAIGGSPLMRITRDQAKALEREVGVEVAVAARLWHPYPREVLVDLAKRGVSRVASLPLAPQSVHVYHASVREAAEGLAMEIAEAPSYGLEPLLVDALVETIDEALARAPSATVVLTAHSLPQRVIDAGDPYERDFRAMASAVGARLTSRGVPWRISFQSQGMSSEAWLGPDLPSTFADLAKSGARAVIVAPIGFVADHVETLYDLDVEAPKLAAAAGIEHFSRAPALNTRATFIAALAAVARRLLG